MSQLKTNLTDLQQTIGYQFSNIDLLTQALIHRSSLNELKKQFKQSNERLEYLGDAVLELWSSNHIFHQFPQFEEGELTNLRSLIVRTENLAEIAKTIGLGNFLYLSHGEDAHLGRQNISILADSLEALIGAIFLDGGFTASDQFLTKFLKSSVNQLSAQQDYKDPKSLYQEIAQKYDNITPHYQIISETGPDHEKQFTVGVYLKDKLVSTGTGNSKQKAESDAARNAINLTKKSS